MNDYDYDNDHEPFLGDSDEDTEDASETECQYDQNGDLNERRRYDSFGQSSNFTPDCGPCQSYNDDFDSTYEIKEQIYRDKLTQLQSHAEQLEKHTHPDYEQGLKRLENDLKERMFTLNCNFETEKALIESECRAEERAASKEFLERKYELIEGLVSDLEDKRKMIETDNFYDLVNDQSEPKTLTTRKLRRRPNDPTPIPDRRRRTSPTHINYRLEENEINEDIKSITKYLNSASSKSTSSSSQQFHKDDSNDVRIEHGKLFYDKRWYCRGQNIFLESIDETTPAQIVQISLSDIHVKRSVSSNETIKIKISDLQSRKFSIQKRGYN